MGVGALTNNTRKLETVFKPSKILYPVQCYNNPETAADYIISAVNCKIGQIPQLCDNYTARSRPTVSTRKQQQSAAECCTFWPTWETVPVAVHADDEAAPGAEEVHIEEGSSATVTQLPNILHLMLQPW